ELGPVLQPAGVVHHGALALLHLGAAPDGQILDLQSILHRHDRSSRRGCWRRLLPASDEEQRHACHQPEPAGGGEMVGHPTQPWGWSQVSEKARKAVDDALPNWSRGNARPRASTLPTRALPPWQATNSENISWRPVADCAGRYSTRNGSPPSLQVRLSGPSSVSASSM